MIELTWVPEAIKGLTWLYVLVALASLTAALVWPKTWPGKAGCAAVAVAVFGYLPFTVGKAVFQEREAAAASQQRLAAAMAHFQMRCKSAGEKITRTVDNVDGVVWMKWRDERGNDGDQFQLDDPFGRDCGGEGCIAALLRATRGLELNREEASRYQVGYTYVESTAIPASGAHRFIGVIKLRPIWTPAAIAREKQLTGKQIEPGDHSFAIESRPIQMLSARYGITWDDISTREDREYWIAGGSLKVVDLTTGEVIAERIGYMLDRGQGSRAGFRSPWGYAPETACPEFERASSGAPFMSYRTRNFVVRVLRPSTGD